MTKKISYYLFLYIFSIVVYLFLNIYNLNNNLMKNTEYFLKNVAKSLNFVLTEEYLLKSTNPKGVTKNEYSLVNNNINTYISGTDIKRLFTLSHFNSEFYYSSYGDKGNTNVEYFSKYTEDNLVFDIYKNRKFKMIKNNNYVRAYIPYINKDSKFYMIVIDYNLTYADKIFYRNIFIFILSSLFLFLMTINFVIFYKKTHKTLISVENELKDIKKKKRELSKHKMIFEEKSKFDSLTKIRNREYIYEFYHEKCKEFNGNPFVVMLMDLDRFKQINDTYGHHLGDKVLIRTTREICKRVRDMDAFGRIGGDEFLLVFSSTDLTRGKDLAEKITSDVRSLEFFHEEELIKISCSIGLMQYVGQEPHEFLKIVDKYLYKAKENRDGFATIWYLE